MQSNMFWAMLRTQYQVASLLQIALLAHVIVVLESRIKKMAGIFPMQSNIFLDMLKTQYQVASLMQIAGTCDSGAQKLTQTNGGSFPHAEQCLFGHAENTVPSWQPHADCFAGTRDSGARKSACWHMWLWKHSASCQNQNTDSKSGGSFPRAI